MAGCERVTEALRAVASNTPRSISPTTAPNNEGLGLPSTAAIDISGRSAKKPMKALSSAKSVASRKTLS
jgi:hypothetical protein